MVTLYEFITSERCAQLMEQIETQTDDMLEIDVSEKKAHDSTWRRRGELIRSVQKIQIELSTEIDRIVGAPAGASAARAT
jgi:nuclear transport factor 2 (NTF2) superfamily protein